MIPRFDSTDIEAAPRSGSIVSVPRAPVTNQSEAPADFIGRADELSSLQRFVDEPGEPCLLLAGASGSGRTRLLHVLHHTRPDSTVLVADRSTASQQPGSGVTALLGALGSPVGEVFSAVEREPDPDGAAARALRALMQRPSPDTGPLVLLVDDLDNQDELSQAVIAGLFARHTDSPARMIASVGWPLTGRRFDAIPVMRLNPLTEEHMRRIAPVVSNQRIDPVTAELLARLSSGLPGVLAAHLERLTDAQRSGRAPLTLPLPPAFPRTAETIATRFGLQDEDLEVLRRIAAAPAVSIDALPALIGVAIDRLEPLVARGLVARASGYVSLPDPELRSELYWQLSSAGRRSVHAAAAEAEERADADLRDWHVSHLRTDASIASGLYASSSSLLHKGLTLESLELAERALAHTSVGRPVQQQLEFARDLLLHGAPDLARRHLPRDAAAMSRRQILQRGALELVMQVLGEGDLDMSQIDALVGRYRVELPEPVADLLALAGVLLVLEGSVDDGLWRIETATRLRPPGSSGRSLHHWADRLRGAISASGERPRPNIAVPADVEVDVRLSAAVALMWEERYSDAREQFAVVLSGWRGTGSPWAVRALSLAVDNEIRAGELSHAAELAERMRRTDAGSGRFPVLSLAWLALAQGLGGEAERLLGALERELDLRKRLAVHALVRIRGTQALLANDPEGAARRLRAVLHSTLDLDPAVLRVHPELLEAQWRMHDLAGARATAERLAEGVARAPSRWGELALLRCRALLADDVDAAFVTALIAFDGGEQPFDRARTHAWYALALQHAGSLERAAAERQAAAEAFSRLGATAWMRLTYQADTPEVAGRLELPTLTDTELAVLRMARQGAHNRDIASALFMSLRTVELRLTQIYRKFGARSRSHLFTLLPDDWPDQTTRSPRR